MPLTIKKALPLEPLYTSTIATGNWLYGWEILGQIHRYECLMTTTPAEVLDTRQLSRGFDTQTVAETATIESSIRRFATEVARLHAQLLDDASQCP